MSLTTRRDFMTQFLDGKTFENYVPTVFFMHFPTGTGRDAVYYHVRHMNRTSALASLFLCAHRGSCERGIRHRGSGDH